MGSACEQRIKMYRKKKSESVGKNSLYFSCFEWSANIDIVNITDIIFED